MSSSPVAGRREPIPIPERFRSIAGAGPLALEVAEILELSPGMRRIRLTGSDLRTFTCLPGQDLMVMVAADAARTTSRRYSIRRFDPERLLLDLDIVVHAGGGPGMRWANELRPGDLVNAVGPRGKITLAADADWHLLAGDESAIGVTLAMLEALNGDARGFGILEIAGPEFELPHGLDNDPRRRVTWLHRGRGPTLTEAVATAELPPGTGHVYINGEVGLVNAVKRAALERGLAAEQISAKAYWGRGESNAGNGEPEKRPE